ncbi:GumC family protein [Anabaena catenula]|uniref:non-specific protein-tyrosine kinase n=1 Tax=Anabaena catenula FACHB-362 TaxID=2692877 RepID=A0ABR8IZI4_9NOST|nr:polysaccharide biosynthesis tyrosine autokinase [Anabaena catenula]MBD2690206.1 polysaccharide biosynthesis tyrosine autokinase [Anabaena catenula FACHB-362]
MINQNSNIVSNAHENGKVTVAPALLPFQPFSPLETEDEDWNPRELLGILRRRALVISVVVVSVMGAVAYSTLNQEKIYQGNFQLLVEPVTGDNTLQTLNLPDSTVPKSGLDYDSQIQVLKSQEVMQNVIKELPSSSSYITYNYLIRNLTIRRLGSTKLIEVSYKSKFPQEIKIVLDTISKYYLKNSLEKRQTKLRQGLEFVDKQLPLLKERVTQQQQLLQIFRQRYEFIDPESKSTSVAQQMQTLDQQRLDVNQQLATARAAYISLSTREGKLATLNNAPIYGQLVVQLRQLETQISAELVRFQPDNPVIKSLEEKRRNLLPLLEEEANRFLGLRVAEATTQIQKLEVESQELAKVEQQLKRRFQQLPILARQYSEIQRNLQVANDSLNRFLTTKQELSIGVAQTEIPWELIQAPRQGELPISPDIPRSLLLGLMTSLAAGIGIGLLLEKMDNTYHSVESMKEKLKLPFLGSLPLDKQISTNQLSNPKNGVAGEENWSGNLSQNIGWFSNLFRSNRNGGDGYYGQGIFWESLQVLYSNIQLLNSDKPIHALVVSSAMPGDGKTTVSFHIAQIAAALGKRVLLVDADLRRPQVHKVSNLHNLSGLSNVISSNMAVEQVIQQIPSMDLLSVITAGPTPPDPARLLSSDKMKQLMEYFKKNFDLVIYDAPPMLGLVDARLLAPHTDGMVLVARIDKTDKSALIQLQETLRTSPINVLGVVANGDNKKLSGYNNYYYTNRKEARFG